MAKRSWFNPPVPILLGQHVRRVNSLEIAYEALMGDDWPLHDWSYTRAAETLIKAIEGKASREEARLAFEAAALLHCCPKGQGSRALDNARSHNRCRK